MTMGPNYFGTDGIRGRVGEMPITADFLLKLGWAVGAALGSDSPKKVLIGKDTRISGYLIESALQAGLSAMGANVYLTGPMPTPAIAYLTRAFHAQIGLVISASHNPYFDNGVKFFSSDGFKISKKFEESVNYWLEQPIKTLSSEKLGKSFRIRDAIGRYIEFCKSSVPHQTYFSNLKIVIDCANGTTFHIAPDVFSELGAKVISIHNTPDGFNINEKCGSTHPEEIRKHVLEQKADVGIAFDGDGDRVIMVDHLGEIIDGDEILYIIAKGLLSIQRFSGGVVGTVMSNLGLERAINDLGLMFMRVPVGDQNIVEKLIEKNWQIGGEPSGHIINLNVNTTGDGVIAALQVLQTMIESGKSLHDLKQGMTKFPQKIVNVALDGKTIDLENEKITSCIKQSENALGKYGRILIRESKTEPVIRIMVEGDNTEKVDHITNDLKTVIEEEKI